MTGQLPSNCQLARLLMTEGDILAKAERNLVATLLDQVPPVAAAITVAKQLNALLRRKTSESLTAILDAAVATPLKDFAAGLRRDVAARPSRTRLAVDNEPRRGPDQPVEDAEAHHVWPCRVPTASCSCPPRRVAKQHAKCGRTRIFPRSAEVKLHTSAGQGFGKRSLFFWRPPSAPRRWC